MAQRVMRVLESDLDGSPADETVLVGVDGKQVEIDLSAKQATELREFLAPYLAAGRLAGNGRHARKAAPKRTDYEAIRAWAKAEGIAVSEQGRIPQPVIDRYDARHA